MNGKAAYTRGHAVNGPARCDTPLLTLWQGTKRPNQLDAITIGHLRRRSRACSYQDLTGGILRKHNLYQSQHEPDLLFRPGGPHLLAWADVALARHISRVVSCLLPFIVQ